MENHILIQVAAEIIEYYILAVKGISVKIALPIQQKDEEKFIKAFNIACVYLNVKI